VVPEWLKTELKFKFELNAGNKQEAKAGGHLSARALPFLF
jgi:hypothetical protein